MPEDQEQDQAAHLPPDQDIITGWVSCLRAYTKAVNSGSLKKIRECQEALRQYEEYGPAAIVRLYGG